MNQNIIFKQKNKQMKQFKIKDNIGKTYYVMAETRFKAIAKAR